MTDYRLTGEQRDALLSDLDDLASRAGGILSRATRPRTLLRELEPWVEPEPEPEPAATLYGANPHASGKRPDIDDLAAIVGRYKVGAAVRIFDGTGTLNPAPTAPGVGFIHASWKSNQSALLSGALDDQVRAAIEYLSDGDAAEDWHEPDVKGLDPVQQLAYRQAWVRAVKAVRPDIIVPCTLGGYRWDPADSKGGPDKWAECVRACDLLGVDLDGTPAKALPYRDYRPIVDRILAWMDRYGITRWAVPEIAVKRAPDDPTGERRAEWMHVQAEYLAALGDRAPEWVCWFESSTVADFAGTELNAVEVEAWSRLIAS